jgi:hypothetical protein
MLVFQLHQACGSQYQETSILCPVMCIAKKEKKIILHNSHLYGFLSGIKKLKAT